MDITLASTFAELNLFRDEKKTFILWMVLELLTCHSHAFDMQDYCNKEISMTSESIYQMELRLDDISIYNRRRFLSSRRGECETSVRGWNSPYSKLMFYFKHLDLDCDDGQLGFYVDREGTRVTGLEDNICNDNKPRGIFTIDDQYLRIKYIPKKTQNIEHVFSIIITAFSDDTCESYSHKCDNSRCINKDIICNEYDSCGDGSGCDKQMTSVIVGAIVGSVSVIGIIVSLIVCYICHKKRAKRESAKYQKRVVYSNEVPGQRFGTQTRDSSNEVPGKRPDARTRDSSNEVPGKRPDARTRDSSNEVTGKKRLQ